MRSWSTTADTEAARGAEIVFACVGNDDDVRSVVYGETGAFAGMYQEVAAAEEAELVPFLLDGVALDPTLMQDDGIHPVADAQPALLDNIWPTLLSLLEG